MAGDAGGSLGTGVSEQYINRVHPGQPIEAVLDAYGDWRIPAHVITTVPSADRGLAEGNDGIEFWRRSGGGEVSSPSATPPRWPPGRATFTGAPGEGMARLTAYATGKVGTRTANGDPNLDIAGELPSTRSQRRSQLRERTRSRAQVARTPHHQDTPPSSRRTPASRP
jgi:hypothetical protein